MSALLLLVLMGCDDAPVETTQTETDTMVEDAMYMSAETCAECHPNQYAEWRQSMHAYAALSPVFDAMAQKAFRDTAGEVGTFCTGCHTPQGTLDGEPGSTMADQRSHLSREGITCDVCHTVTAVSTPIGNAILDNDLTGPKLGPYTDPSTDGHSAAHGEVTTSPELCGSCHDVFSHPGLRIEEAYTEYLQSPAYEEGTRCQDCHMGPVPGYPAERKMGQTAVVEGKTYPERELSSHRFVGPDYSLLDTFPYPDDVDASLAAQAEYLEQVQVLMENAAELANLIVSRDDETDTWNVIVEVTNKNKGHNFPTGFTSERQAWLEVVATDPDGEVVFTSGDLDSYGDLRDAHSWDVLLGEVELDEQLVNFQSKNVGYQRLYREDGTFDEANSDLDAANEEEEVIFPFDANYIEKHSIDPDHTSPFQYSFESEASQIELSVVLKYRNLPPYVLRALQLDEMTDRLQIITIDEKTWPE